MSNVSKLWRCSTLVKTGHCSIVPGKSILCTSPPSIYSIPRDFPFICTHYTVDLFIELSSFRVIRKHHLINTCKQKSILPAKRRKRYRDLWFSKARTLVTLLAVAKLRARSFFLDRYGSMVPRLD